VDDRARTAVIVAGAVAALLAAAYLLARERGERPEPVGVGAGFTTGEVLAHAPVDGARDGGVEGDPLGPKPVVDGVVQPRYAVTDGGRFGSEQPPEGYTGEPTDELDYDPELVERPAPPDLEVLDEAALRARHEEQAAFIDQSIEDLDRQIGDARDRGQGDMVHILEVRRHHLEERRDVLRGLP